MVSPPVEVRNDFSRDFRIFPTLELDRVRP